MHVTNVNVSNGGLLLSGGTGEFKIGDECNFLTCGVFKKDFPIEHKQYCISFKYIGQRFEFKMSCTLSSAHSKFVGPKTQNDPIEEIS